MPDGSIVGQAGSLGSRGKQILGGTVMILSEDDGAIEDAYIYYFEEKTTINQSTEEEIVSENCMCYNGAADSSSITQKGT